MTPITTPSTDLDALLGAVLDIPLWTDEPAADRLAMVLLLDPQAARPRDIIEEANRSGWDDARTMFAWLGDREGLAAVRRRAEDVGFQVKRLVARLGRCVDLPADVAAKIRNELRDRLLRNATRDALVGILRTAGASTARTIAASNEPADDEGQAEKKAARAKKLDRHDVQILRACCERRKDQREIETASGVSYGNVKKRTDRLQVAEWLELGKDDGGWITTRDGRRELERRGLLNSTVAESRAMRNTKARGFGSK